MAQDDYYYEIQLTNKQLVFYFMAGATGLILSFLAGVMVGRGVDTAAGDVQAARPVLEDKVVAEEPAAHPSTKPPAEELSYAKRLEGDKPEEASLEPGGRSGKSAATGESRGAPVPATSPAAKNKATGAVAKPSAGSKAAPGATPATPVASAPATPSPAPSVASMSASEAKPTASPKAKEPALASSKTPAVAKSAPLSFTIQVGAFKDKSTADSVVTRLQAKGFAAYVVTPDGSDAGLFNVRVGSYPARTEAERVQAKLRDQEKFKPFIIRN